MLNIIKNTINRVFASGVDSDASAFITATGLSGTTEKSAITTLVKDLKSSGLWSKMKAVYPMITDNYNLLSYTEDFTNAFWSKYNSTITANTTTAPNGTLTADSFNDGAANNYHQVYTQINSLPIGTYTFSFYLKSNTNTKNIAIYPFGTATPGGTGTGGVILTQNGTFVANASGGVVSYGSQDVGNGWRRFYVVGTSTAISNVYPVISYADGTNVIYTGTNTDAYIWGAQYELGSTMSTYQPILTTPSAYMASQMKYNLKDPRDLDAAFRLTWSGGWTYSATGATPNGTNAYADTKLVPNANFTSNNSSFSVYSRTENTNVGDVMGTSSASTNRCFMFIRYGANQSQINHNSNTPLVPTALTSLGNFLSSRTALGHRYYVNNALSASANSAEGGFSTVSFYIGADNTSGSAANYTNRQFAFSHIGDGLTDQESYLFNQIVEKYQVALSRGVQAAQSFYYNSAYSNEANIYLYSTQITGTTQVSAINTLINGLKANNLWSKMKAVYPFVTDKSLQADMAAQMKFNLVNPQDSDAAFRLAFSGGWTYSTNGAQPNGTNGYADTKLVPSTALTLNSTHLSFYSRTNQAAGNIYEFGVSPNPSDLPLMLLSLKFFVGDAIRSSQYDYDVTNIYTSANANSTGYYSGTRTSANSHKVYKNGALLGTNTVTSAQALPGTQPLYMSAGNFQGTANRFSSKQVAFASIGDGLSDAEAALLYQLVQQFQTDLSRQV
jgi:hypothetical protein